MVRFDLPWDLVEQEIFARVPATCLRRLRFTCKRWNALFKEPNFIKTHLDKAAKPYSVLLLSCFRVYSLSVNINAIHNNVDVDPSIVFTAKLSRNLKESEEVKITRVSHCNGLLLCFTNEEETKLVVVNPCTGQTRWIKLRSVYDIFDEYALGYENNKKHSYDSCKILRFPGGDRDNLEIFELKSNSWRVLANIPLKVLQCAFMRRGMSVKGNTYWLSWFLNEFDILSFDFATERFRRLCLPSVFNDSNFAALSDVREEKLAVLHWRPDMPQMEIWMSKEIDNTETVLSWSKSFKFDLHPDIDFRFLRRSVSFFIDEEKKVIVCSGRSIEENNKNIIYIVGKHGCRKFDTNQSSQWPLFLFGYVPSLVSLNPTM